ncbi:MAG: C40 family peptidase [Bacteroidales bacterium]|nr:C40 family peptidase [Bacteroidales bacterium]
MNFGISEFSIVPVRKDPSHRTEMSTQILFGERFKILDKIKDWAFVELLFDGSHGWVENRSIKELNMEEYHILTVNVPVILPRISVAQSIDLPLLSEITLMPGSEIYGMTGKKNSFNFIGKNYKLDYPVEIKSGTTRDNIIETAKTYMNSPCLWGGKSPCGTDCAGFVQMVYKINGISLPRDVGQQPVKGITLSFVEEAQPGDLAFFDDDRGQIKHVGLLLEKNQIIHASDIVRIDKFDHQGIYREEFDQYTHKLRVVKTILK